MAFELSSHICVRGLMGIYKRTKRYCDVECIDGFHVLFNTVLNKPILLTNEAFDFFVNNESIDDSLLKDDEKEAVFELISSFLYVKEDFDEYEVCREKNNEYLSRFADGLTFEFLDLRVSEACNFGCRHCIAKESNKKRIMNSKDALKYIDEFVKFKRRDPEFNQLNIHFGNCEPLLNFDVVKDCIDYVEETYKDLKLYPFSSS